MQVVSSTAPALRPYRYASPESPTRCSAPILVAKSEAPTKGHPNFRPARKNCELVLLAPFRTAIKSPAVTLAATATQQIMMSSGVKESDKPSSPVEKSAGMGERLKDYRGIY